MPGAVTRDSAGDWKHGAHPPPTLIGRLLAGSGVRVNGDAPWDLAVHSPEVYRRVLASGSLGHGERFYRMWRYYLLSCAGTFRAGRSRLWQLVLSRADERPDYRSWRPRASWPAAR